jgi:uncharacterized protein (TIGR03663 family)
MQEDSFPMLDVDQRPAIAPRRDPDLATPIDRPDDDQHLDRTIPLGRISGETLAWSGVLITAALLRLASLGIDALSPDGARHAYAAYNLFRGGSTALDSAAGGPFAVVFGAILLFLFGISDQIVRLGPALAGIGSVALVLWLRPYLGRAGALLAAFFLAISPVATYFSRLEEPDAYATFFALLLFVGLLRLCDGGGRGAMILTAVAAAFLFVAAPVGPTLLLVFLGAALVLWFRGRATALTGIDDERAAFGAPGLLDGVRAGGLYALLGAVAVLLLVFSAFGAVPTNIASGPAEWIGAWIGTFTGPGGMADGRDGLFALGLLPLYESLALLAGIAGALRLFIGPALPAEQGRGGGVARAILTAWALVGVLLVLIAGARQPGLLLLASVPLTLLAGAAIGELVERIDWQREGSFWSSGCGLIAFTTLALIAWGATIGQVLQPSRFPDETGRMLSLLLTVLLFALPLSGAALWFARRTDPTSAWRALAFGVALFLIGFGLRSAVGLNIYRANAANEPIVYAASTPEIRPLMERILRLSRDLTALNRTLADPTGGHGLNVAVDPAVEWPVRWYLRDFPSLTIVSTAALASGTAQTTATPQLIFRPGDGQPATGGFTPQTYKFVWSYPAGQPLVGTDNPLLRTLGFLVFRNNVAPTGSANMTVEYGPDLAQRLFLPPAPEGPFNLTDRLGLGKAPGQFDSPRDVAIAADGSIFAVDMRNARVQHYAADGTFIGQFSSLGHGDGQLWREGSRGPTGIAVGADGFVYVADTWNYRIQKFTPEGQFVAKWGTYVNLVTGTQAGERSGLYGPRGIAIGPEGDLYVTDTGNGRVVVYGPNGEFRREFGTKGAAAGQLDEPVGIAVSADGSRVYVADSNNARIAVFDGAGQPIAQWAVEDWRGKSYFEPYLALDSSGALYATSSANRQVLKFDQNGAVVARANGGAAAEDTFGAPFGIAIAPDGGIYVSDGSKHFVTKMNPLGGR